MKKRSVGRPKKEPDELLVDLSSKVSPETIDAIDQIAAQLDRPRGWTARKLLIRGIAAYMRDVQTMRPEDAIQELEKKDDCAMVTGKMERSPEEPVDDLIGERVIKIADIGDNGGNAEEFQPAKSPSRES